MINIGKYIEIAINWLTEHFARFFDVINDGVGGFIDAFQDGLTWIPFYVMILDVYKRQIQRVCESRLVENTSHV